MNTANDFQSFSNFPIEFEAITGILRTLRIKFCMRKSGCYKL